MRKETHIAAGILISITFMPKISMFLLMVNDLLYAFFYFQIFVAGTIGSFFPDLDLIFKNRNFHRTLTHWPYPYIFLGFIGYYYRCTFLLVFSLTALSHIMLDFFNPTGVPFGKNPFKKRTSSPICQMKTKSWQDFILFFVFTTLTILIIFEDF